MVKKEKYIEECIEENGECYISNLSLKKEEIELMCRLNGWWFDVLSDGYSVYNELF